MDLSLLINSGMTLSGNFITIADRPWLNKSIKATMRQRDYFKKKRSKVTPVQIICVSRQLSGQVSDGVLMVAAKQGGKRFIGSMAEW